MSRFSRLCAVVALSIAAGPAVALENNAKPLPFPAAIGGPFQLSDGQGRIRTEADPDGRTQLLFFGYANCPGMCPVALPLMAEITDILAADGIAVRPVMITVDPDRDTPAAMATALGRFHPDFIGLTGDPAALANAYDAFSVSPQLMLQDPSAGAIFAHATQIFVLSAEGQVMSVLPPILPGKRLAEIVARYATY